MAIKVKQKHGGAINRIQKGDTTNGGRPPLLLSTIVAELRTKGYERATAGTVADAFETLLNVTHEDLVKMGQDPKSPMSLRIVAKGMLNAKGWEVLQAMLDRAHGKAKQAIDHTSDGKAIAPTSIAITREVVTRKV